MTCQNSLIIEVALILLTLLIVSKSKGGKDIKGDGINGQVKVTRSKEKENG